MPSLQAANSGIVSQRRRSSRSHSQVPPVWDSRVAYYREVIVSIHELLVREVSFFLSFFLRRRQEEKKGGKLFERTLTAMMYAMVAKVVRPALTSLKKVASFSSFGYIFLH